MDLLKRWSKGTHNGWVRRKSDNSIRTNMLIFCGQFIPIIEFTWKEEYSGPAQKIRQEPIEHNEIFYSRSQIEKFIKRNPDLEVLEPNLTPFKKRWSTYSRFTTLDNIFLGDEYNQLCGFSWINLHRHFNSPVIRVKYTNPEKYYGKEQVFIVNPILRDLQFARCRNPFSVFQDIQSYISGVLGCNEKPITQVSDEIKIAKHGMDKTSFRKSPTKRIKKK